MAYAPLTTATDMNLYLVAVNRDYMYYINMVQQLHRVLPTSHVMQTSAYIAIFH